MPFGVQWTFYTCAHLCNHPQDETGHFWLLVGDLKGLSFLLIARLCLLLTFAPWAHVHLELASSSLPLCETHPCCMRVCACTRVHACVHKCIHASGLRLLLLVAHILLPLRCGLCQLCLLKNRSSRIWWIPACHLFLASASLSRVMTCPVFPFASSDVDLLGGLVGT